MKAESSYLVWPTPVKVLSACCTAMCGSGSGWRVKGQNGHLTLSKMEPVNAVAME